MPIDVVIQLMERDEFLAMKNSFNLSNEFRQKLHSYVECHKNFLGAEDSDFRHAIFFAHEQGSCQGVAFHYFYVKLSTGQCELFGLFVEPQYRSKGLGAELLAKALDLSVSLGVTFVSISLTGKNSSTGKLVANFLRKTQKYRPVVQFRVIADDKYL
ncbi:GNAT family N-acetyltransferase [Vogesella indigofera]|uniref:GNAT family N-acetyltransferase n=1 Tax=Vogesella indigofera TaxID=45465 RepID=UPI00234FA956|nr:GNAT family N-acetyltransferase [Vogesella indigofera]MDC7701413.1 GNAT family N-acetyltransferase [Vogesella indigofera]